MPKITKQTFKPKPKASNVLSRIVDVSTLPFGKMKCLFYGRSGTGKTRLLSTWKKPLLILGAEEGTKSIRGTPGIDYIRLRSSDELGPLMQHIRDCNKYKSVGLDTATTLQDLILKEILKLPEVPLNKEWGSISRDEYRDRSNRVKERLRRLLQLAEDDVCDVIILAQERMKDDENNSDLILPYIMGDLSDASIGWLQPICDYIGQTFTRQMSITKEIKVAGKKQTNTLRLKDKYEFCLRTGPHEIYTTKFRVPVGSEIPPVIINPDYAKIVAIANGKSH